MRTSRWENLYGLLGLTLFMGIWQLIGAYHFAGPSIPAVTDVLAIYSVPWKLALLGRASAATLFSALIGLCVGVVLGTFVAVLAHVLVPMRPGLDRLSVMVNAVPAVALGPILIVTVGRDWTPSTLAAIPVFFLIYVTVSAGLRSVNSLLGEVFSTLGAGRFTRLLYLEAPAAIPALMGGVRLSVSAAIVGAIVGEWFGASAGLGIVILNTMLNFQIALMWATVVLAASASLAAYGIACIVERAARSRFS